ncbi:MAG: MFS transporter [Acidobacteria bacterium]|nr:MFS transporter [Acidobacteriota bacterium]
MPYRWWILTLLTLGTVINYLDRLALTLLNPLIREELKLDDETYGWVTAAFQGCYTIGFLVMGKFVDRYGTRLGYTVAAIWWSFAGIATTFARAPIDLAVMRGLLGLGEAGNFPSAIKAVAEWFPPKDRAFATGIFNAGTNVATMIGPALFVAMSGMYGWRACFAITGGLGLIWAITWWFSYYVPQSANEPAGAKAEPMPWSQTLRYRQTWGFALGKFFSDPVWWFLLFWLPLYLYNVRGLDMKQVSWILPFIYFVADIGSVAGGWLSGYFMRQGWPVARARKAALLVFACMPPIAAAAVLVDNLYVAVGLFSLATAAHQGWSANLYTITSDVFPRRAVASVTGIGGAVGGFSGMLFSAIVPGYVVPRLGYVPLFLGMSCFYLIGWVCIHALLRNFEPVEDSLAAEQR